MMNKIILILCLSLLNQPVLAGEGSCNCTVGDIEKELSYLAKKLLEVTGKDSYTLKQEPSEKASFGACFEVVTEGVKLTCITPDMNPEKQGLMIGDIIVAMNDSTFPGITTFDSHEKLHQITDNLQAGDVLKIQYTRAGQTFTSEIEVGELKHPGYMFKVSQ
ncbi:hypothetical protein [Marinicella sp. W31]|uniref:hypothetical protein n=1 Tax=Marinicella sp. W31 TaxID=3023713 RepID=UPI00375814A2